MYRPKIEVRGLRYGAGGTEILAGDVPRAFVVVALAVGVAAVATLGLLLALGVMPATARYLIPLGAWRSGTP